MDLLLEIARCPIAASCLEVRSSQHGCAAIVHNQDVKSLDEFQLPEPWSGDIEKAPILFVGSNPSIANDPPDRFPRGWWQDEDIQKYFVNRFSGTEKVWVDHRAFRRVTYWAKIWARAKEILGDGCRPGIHFALTEVVHCKSQREAAVDGALPTCRDRYLRRVLEKSGAGVIAVLGKKSRTAVQDCLDIPSWENPYRIELNGRLRYVVFLGHPSSGEPQSFRRCVPDHVDFLRDWLSDSTSG